MAQKKRANRPVSLRFASGPAATHEDMFGELEIRVLQVQLRGMGTVVAGAGPLGWGGDRYRVYDTPNGPALVWYVVWDDAKAGERFLALSGERLRALRRPGALFAARIGRQLADRSR